MQLILCDTAQSSAVEAALLPAQASLRQRSCRVLPFDRWQRTPLLAGSRHEQPLHHWPDGMWIEDEPVDHLIWLAAYHDVAASTTDALLRAKWLGAASLVFPDACGLPRACDPVFAADAVTRVECLSRCLGWDCAVIRVAGESAAAQGEAAWPPVGTSDGLVFHRPKGRARMGVLALGRIWRLSDAGAVQDLGPSGLPQADLFELIFHEGAQTSSCPTLVWASPGLMLWLSLQRTRMAVGELLRGLAA